MKVDGIEQDVEKIYSFKDEASTYDLIQIGPQPSYYTKVREWRQPFIEKFAPSVALTELAKDCPNELDKEKMFVELEAMLKDIKKETGDPPTPTYDEQIEMIMHNVKLLNQFCEDEIDFNKEPRSIISILSVDKHISYLNARVYG